MFWLSCGLVFVVVVVVVAIKLFAKLAPRMGLIALPGGHRQHHSPTPMVGGIGLYLGLLVGLVLVDRSFVDLMPSLLLLCMVGMLDDRYALPSWLRLLVQALAAYLMIKLTGVQLLSLGHLVSPEHELLLGQWSIPLTIFATIGVTNAVNMSDGVDGLAAGMVLLVLIALLVMGASNSGLILISIASVIGFLFWNLRVFRNRASVFMGDAGSTMLGLLTAYLLISFSQEPNGIAPATALWLLALPLIDAVSVLIVRPLRGKSPFTADRIHYHHQLAEKGWCANRVLLVSLALQAGLILTGVVLWQVRFAEHLQLSLFLLLFGGYFIRVIWYTQKAV